MGCYLQQYLSWWIQFKLQNFYLFTWYDDFIYTGDVVINATYRLTDENALELSFIATTTKATPINLSSHCYFNLGKNKWLINVTET